MEPTLAWVDLTAEDRDRMRRVLDLFNERGTLDEMGLGSLRDTLADTLFPGTSTIQTRLRYVLFIAWLYQRLEARKIRSSSVEERARKAELDLIAPLQRSGDSGGVIGALAGTSLARLPSSIYWGALVRWGIFRPERSQSWYHASFDALGSRGDGPERADDPGVVWTRAPHWHPQLPGPPRAFPYEASFALTPLEADFLRGRIEECCAGSLLAWLARNGSVSPAEVLWADPDAWSAPQSIRDVVELARRFSLHVEGMPILYNLLLAERRNEQPGRDESDRIHRYRRDLADWATREAQEEQPFRPDRLWALVVRARGRLRPPQQRFLTAWSARMAELDPESVAADPELRTLIANRERQTKGPRARLANLGRLLEWVPGVGIGRLEFRWGRVRQLLRDLHHGLIA